MNLASIQSGSFLFVGEVFNLLPGELRLGASEVSAVGSHFEDGSLQLEIPDDDSRAQIEVSVNYSLKILVCIS